MKIKNQDITKEELAFIRSLEDFDLTMMISEIHENGWVSQKHANIGGRAMIPLIKDAIKARAEGTAYPVEWSSFSEMMEAATKPGAPLHKHPSILNPRKRHKS